MRTELNTQLKEALAKVGIATVAKQLGYQCSEKLETHLNKIIDQEFLGLNSGYYDFKYGTRELIKALILPLGLSEKLVEACFNEVDQGINLYNRKAPYIYIKTDFSIKNNTMPIFALAFLHCKRLIRIPYEVFDADREEMLPYVSDFAREHYQKSGGKVEFWGNIEVYHYHHCDGSVAYFSVDGEMKPEMGIHKSRATLRI